MNTLLGFLLIISILFSPLKVSSYFRTRHDNKNGIILTRPIKLGDDMLKTVNNIVCRGVFNKTDISFVLYASTDGIFYFPVGSVIGPYLSRICGTPFKYFRILVTANLTRKKSISVISVYYTPKWRNKPR